MSDLQLLPRCPDCGRLTVDNPQHCPEKEPARWATHCQLRKCIGTVTNGEGKPTRCGKVYGADGWHGFRTSA